MISNLLIPVTENMMMLKQEPVKAFKYQDHEAHISVHMAAMQDPKNARACRAVTVCTSYWCMLWQRTLQNMLHSNTDVRWKKDAWCRNAKRRSATTRRCRGRDLKTCKRSSRKACCRKVKSEAQQEQINNNNKILLYKCNK